MRALIKAPSPRVKICGISHPADAAAARADAGGRRFRRGDSGPIASPGLAAAGAPGFLGRAERQVGGGNGGGQPGGDGRRPRADPAPDYVQVHDLEQPPPAELAGRVIPTFRVGPGGLEPDLGPIDAPPGPCRFTGPCGGSGQAWDWTLAPRLVGRAATYLLSGGLDPDNCRRRRAPVAAPGASTYRPGSKPQAGKTHAGSRPSSNAPSGPSTFHDR